MKIISIVTSITNWITTRNIVFTSTKNVAIAKKWITSKKIVVKKNDRYNEFEQNIKTKNSKNSKFIIFATYIDLINFNAIELIIDRLFDSSTNIWILNSNVIQHCSNNKNLFRNLKSTNDVARTTNNEILKMKIIDNVSIELFNEKILILTNVHYLSKLISNLISTSCLHHREFNFTYSIQNLCKFSMKIILWFKSIWLTMFTFFDRWCEQMFSSRNFQHQRRSLCKIFSFSLNQRTICRFDIVVLRILNIKTLSKTSTKWKAWTKFMIRFQICFVNFAWKNVNKLKYLKYHK